MAVQHKVYDDNDDAVLLARIRSTVITAYLL